MRSNDSQKIIVVGIPKSMDDTGLSDLFSRFGTVADAKVVFDTSTKQSRGFGFVTFTAISSVKKAIEAMDKQTIEGGRTLNVRHLIPKDKFEKKETNDSKTKQRPCWLLRKGKCTKGDACNFSHEIKDGEFGSCFEYVQAGTCKRGDKCIFSHSIPMNEEEESDEEEVFQDIITTNKTMTATASPNTSKKEEPIKMDPNRPRVCYSFQNGRCHRGKKCLFLHEKLESLEDPHTKTKSKKQQKTDNTMSVGKKRPRKEEGQQQEEDAKEKKKEKDEDAPLQGLAAHVLNFMQSQNKISTNHLGTIYPPASTSNFSSAPSAVSTQVNQSPLKKKKKLSTKPSPQYHEDRPQKKKEKIDMGAAFDGCLSDEEEEPTFVKTNSRKKKPSREEMKATRQKLQQQRKEKRSAKKNALERLKQT
jgi:RNA recognition motif-containing protein